MSRSYNMLILPDAPGNMSTFSNLLISMMYYLREMHIETNAVSRKSMLTSTPCIFSKTLAGNKTMLIIPDFTLSSIHLIVFIL